MSLTLPDTIALMAKAGDFWALNELTHYHQRMIRLLAGKAMSDMQSHDRDDLEQEVRAAMLELLKSWKHGAGCSFATYCFNWIPMHLRRRIDSTGYILKLPAWAAVKDRREGNQAIPLAASLFVPTEGDEAVIRQEVESAGNPLQPDYEKRDLMRWLSRSIDQLPERERAAVRATYLGEGTQDDLAMHYNVTRQAISQNARNGLARLRRMAKAAK